MSVSSPDQSMPTSVSADSCRQVQSIMSTSAWPVHAGFSLAPINFGQSCQLQLDQSMPTSTLTSPCRLQPRLVHADFSSASPVDFSSASQCQLQVPASLAKANSEEANKGGTLYAVLPTDDSLIPLPHPDHLFVTSTIRHPPHLLILYLLAPIVTGEGEEENEETVSDGEGRVAVEGVLD
ncbi:hypothetical protein B296_00022037 [Ensete ventricosum]|uniref:Uncharacterized protein n=1 Tax=Ensete ventricosum TaxID=4639 RepID=A0A426ZVE4_ENSVE|nr:hypothetical protein B296_00022037 [Ensete ventricosum]